MSFIQADFSESINYLQHIIDNTLKASIDRTLDQCGESAIQGAQSIVPVRTGRLRDSIRVLQKSADFIIVGSDIEYAADVEFGTFRMEARPYMSPQADRLPSEGAKILENEFRRSL